MKKIAVIPNDTKDIGLKVTKKLVSVLDSKAEIYMQKRYKESGICANFADDELYNSVDAVIVLGGDGTILKAAEPCGRLGIPVMGINMGQVGFMTEIEVCNIEKAVDRLLSDDYKIEERMMMKVKICKDGQERVYYSLNDAVISKTDAQMISVELFREKEKINAYTADGVIISTPTGSTGYSLSAGGPVADPTMELFIATPICAHRLSSRAALLPPDKNILVKLVPNGGEFAEVTVDGQVKEKIECGEWVEINKAKEKLRLIKMGRQSFYDVLTDKLS